MIAAVRRALKISGLGMAALLIVALLWSGGLIWFALAVPDKVEDPATSTDAIVVLTGGSRRLGVGLSLLMQGRAKKLFVSGVHRGVDVAELLRVARQSPAEVECCIALGYAADNTAGNAAETQRWMAEQNYRSLRLVTANYHMRRGLLEFRHAMPGVTIVPHPVFPDRFQRTDWWRRGPALWVVVAEYSKYLAAMARIALGLPAPGAGRGAGAEAGGGEL
jgi:uncharacterized SAM-binding protein YcdF (DUF218 family)